MSEFAWRMTAAFASGAVCCFAAMLFALVVAALVSASRKKSE